MFKNKKNIIFIVIIVIFALAFFLLKTDNSKDDMQVAEELISEDSNDILENSKEFMENYFEEVKNVNSDEEKENMLIVISPSKIENTYGAEKVIEAPNNQYILQYDSEEKKREALSELKDDSTISFVEENVIYTLDEYTKYNSWGITEMSLDNGINSLKNNNGHANDVTVAIIDTGCDLEVFNKYYSGRIIETYNVLQDSTNNMTDEEGHGTHIAGTIAEGTPDNVKILPVKVSTGSTMRTTDIIAAINYITYHKKADVINMSFGCYYEDEALKSAINAANQLNIICVAAAGNDNTSYTHYPSGFENTISISSIDSQLKKSTFSNYGSTITFCAPGSKIKSIMSKEANISKDSKNIDGDDDHETISGTSMATPHAVAAIAILKSYNKNLTKEDVIDLLKDKAIDLGEPGWDEYFGYGLISFENVEFCSSPCCHENCNVYEELNKNGASLELNELKITNFNYYSVTNLLASTFIITYADDISEVVALGDLKNAEVLNYDPLSSETQEVTIKLGSISVKINVTNPATFESGWEYNSLSQKEIQITGYKENNLEIKKLYIPESIDSKKVVSFADDLKFSEESSDFNVYTSLYLPSSFSRIGNYCLSNTNVEYIYGTSNIEVGAHAFENSSIILIENALTKVGEYAFKECYKLTSLDLSGNFSGTSPNNKKISKISIGEYAFYNCKGLVVISSKYDITNIYDGIGEYTFYNCISLLYFPFSVFSDIGEYAFYNTFKLTGIELGDVSSIGKYAFYNSGIQEVEFSISLEKINESTFENCVNLKKVTNIGGRIESRAFWNSGIKQISFQSSIEFISDDAFAYTPMEKCEYDSEGEIYSIISSLGIVENDTNKLIVGFTSESGNSNTDIPSYITEIGEYAFTGNINLNKIIIPSTVIKIGTHAFEDCYNLLYVYFLGNDVEIESTSFKRTYEGEVKNSDIIFYVYKDSNLKKYAINNQIEYRQFDPDKYEIMNVKEQYIVGESFESSSCPEVKLTYYEKEIREEIITYRDGLTNGIISNGYTMYTEYQDNTANSFSYRRYIL